MSKKFIAIAGAAVAAIGIAAANLDDPFEGQSCALSPDGELVATADNGKTYTKLNADRLAVTNPESAAWVEGSTGWSRTPICITRDAEFSMLMKDFVSGGRIEQRPNDEPEYRVPPRPGDKGPVFQQ